MNLLSKLPSPTRLWSSSGAGESEHIHVQEFAPGIVISTLGGAGRTNFVARSGDSSSRIASSGDSSSISVSISISRSSSK